jgi:hypothetical protein
VPRMLFYLSFSIPPGVPYVDEAPRVTPYVYS